jgi:phenylpyruvate tautomerase PptA (4-oxalocrotonate tautomerase family)
METNKHDTPADKQEEPLANPSSRRSFLFQVGSAGLVASTTPLWAAALGESERTSNSSLGPEPAADEIEDEISEVPQDIEKENNAMPLIKIDAFEGRSESEVATLLDAVHRAVVKAFHVPLRDRYQIYQAHPKGFLVIQDTGLGIARTNKALIVTVVSKKRDEILKRRLYKELTEELATSSSIAPSDVVVGIIENTAADWSFGNGEAQFLTGDLG